jgi:hypothetical protein
MRSTAPLAGRKLLFFISDGFVVDAKRSNGSEVMRRVATEAARVGVVIYSPDTRANSSPLRLTSERRPPGFLGPNGEPAALPKARCRKNRSRLSPTRPAAVHLNPNALDEGVAEALSESASYHLLAWRPDSENQRSKVSPSPMVVKGRPGLKVRMRRHFFDLKENQTAATSRRETSTSTTNAPEDELKIALGSLYPHRELPTLVSASFVDSAGKGPVLNVSMQIDGAILSFDDPGDKRPAIVDVLGVAVDDRGHFSSFKQKLDIPREGVLAKDGRFIKWSEALSLPPGLYQVRVAVRDRQSGRTGSAMTWIEIPGR